MSKREPEIRAAEKALKERPVFSIRLQVYFSVFFLFEMCIRDRFDTAESPQPSGTHNPLATP